LSERYVFPFEKLEVWQESLALADEVSRLIDKVPQGRHHRLVSQIEGAVRVRAELLDRKRKGLMNSIRVKGRHGG
jgi:hypothetical protein